MLQQRRHCHKCDYCYSPVTRNYVRSIYQGKNQAMRGQYGHLNNCKEYARQKLLSVQQERNVLTNQFPVVENGPFSSIMQMEEYSNRNGSRCPEQMEHMGRQVWRRGTSGPVGIGETPVPGPRFFLQFQNAADLYTSSSPAHTQYDGWNWNLITMAQNCRRLFRFI